MDTKPESDNPKNKNVTIFVTDDLRNRMDVLRNTHFSAMNMNQFTRYLVEVGLEEEETRFKEKKAQNKARLERAAIPVFSPESAEQKPRKKPSESKVIDMSKYAHNDMPPMDSVKFVGWEMTFLPYVGKTA
ncbi:MAG: hypothetical protein LBH43_15690, partial [Treponema sp.]|nr:hypothetical protein [Treponema sp.]